MKCNLCPRQCNLQRDSITGFCGMTNTLTLAKTDLFLWEEPVVSGLNGSGAVFFSGCNLKCCFCQNFEISSGKKGKQITINRLAEIFKELELKGAHNINLISPTHYVPQIIKALDIYKPNIPIIYNCNGYETLDTLQKLKNYVDVYLVDLKFMDNELSQKYCSAKNYFNIASCAILEMLKQKPKVVLKNNLITSGVIIRHLVMPNCTQDSKNILHWISKNIGTSAMLSLMSQYTPCFNSYMYPEINRKLLPLEYKVIVKYAEKLGLNFGFTQQFESSSTDYIPIWDFKGV